uniref:Solute carrier family 66 member 2 n=1 Tax=Steinernema glaseri TaxID=37863 RepID=A0A1I7Y6N5_9BILA
MMVVDWAGIKLLPLKDLFTMIGGFLADVFMIFGGAIPYVFQYAEIYQRKSALGFSLYVCLALCVANILRILFWFGKHFKNTLLVQSVVMLVCMFLMLEISVRMNRKLLNKSQRTSILNGHFLSHFWQWSDLKSYAIALSLFTAAAAATTAACIGVSMDLEDLVSSILFFQFKCSNGMSKASDSWLC